ncbi:hypothetical protein C8J56DRAFT_873887 [Mycena floridula]|nr:hypothetical protein C8J56DRAFT_873887 [Mycena floridula]
MRTHLAMPSGLPHYTTEDGIHDRYFILKRGIIICNIWYVPWASFSEVLICL